MMTSKNLWSFLWSFLGALVLVGGSAARANDSAAELGAGGIRLVHSAGIAMLQEDLTISVEEIRVRYRFRNDTASAVTTRVAFPVPAWNEREQGDLELDRESMNPVNFSVTVDGKPTPFQTEIKKTGGLVALTHHWQQTFPPRQEISIEHRYRPVAGGFFSPAAAHPNAALDRELATEYCVGPTLLAALKKEERYLRTVRYILTSGANWNGPIGRFRLTLIKSKPADKISLCLADTRRASPLTFVVDRTNFTPTEDLRILFVPASR